MAIRAYYEVGSGRLISVGSVWPEATPPGLDYVWYPGEMADYDLRDYVWDPASRSFGARPPKVFIPRFADLRDNPRWDWFRRNIWDNLTSNQKDQLRAAIEDWLGREIMRAEGDHPVIGYGARESP